MKLIALSCIFWLVWLSSCNEEAINITCADPLGSDAIILKDKDPICYQEKFNNCIWFRLEFSPPELRSVSVIPDNSIATIYDAGEAACLSEVIAKPLSGYVFSTVVQLHHGYIIKLEDGTYGRLFIDSWKKSGSLVTEINIIRQYAY